MRSSGAPTAAFGRLLGVASIWVLVVLAGCSSLSSSYSPQRSELIIPAGASVIVYPFVATPEAFSDDVNASFAVTYVFAEELAARSGREVPVADEVFQPEVSHDDEALEDTSSFAEEGVAPTQFVLGHDDLFRAARDSDADFVIFGLVELYDLLDVEYSVFVYRREDMTLVAEAGGVRRIPWYDIDRDRHTILLTRRIVSSLGYR